MFRDVLAGACVCLATISQTNAAEQWIAVDLGSARTEALCVEAGTSAVLSFANVFGADSIRHSAWTVSATGLSNGPHDAIITCNHAAAKTVRATLVVHSPDKDASRMIARRISMNYAEDYQQREKIWLQEAFRKMGM